MTVAGDNAEFSPLQVLGTLWGYRWSILAAMAGGVALGVLLAFTATLQYRSEALLAPNSDQADGLGIAQLAGQLSGLASVAGIDLGAGEGEHDIAVARLTSRSQMERFVTDNDLMPVLFADQWDVERKQWKASIFGRDDPTVEDAIDLLRKRIVKVSEDRRTGLYTLSVTWRDRELAAKWAAELVARVNAATRDVAIDDARRSQAYLKAELPKTDVVELRSAINRLLEVQLKNEMVASVRTDFAFRVIDPPRVPEADAFVKPRRAMLIAFGAFVGLGFGILLALVRNAVASPRRS
jgi:uncharacterized protein involved in exopolysaccharide biosynthesis